MNSVLSRFTSHQRIFFPVYRAYLNSHKHLLYMQISANFYLIYCFRQATITVPFSQSIRLTSISLLGNQHLYRSNVDLQILITRDTIQNIIRNKIKAYISACVRFN
jgi:hypothetical protein